MTRPRFDEASASNWILSPRLSIQLYAQPLLSAGDYEDFKSSAPEDLRFCPLRHGPGRDPLPTRSRRPTSWLPAVGAPRSPSRTPISPGSRCGSTRRALGVPPRLDALPRVDTEPRQHANPGDFEMGRDLDNLMSAPADDVLMVKGELSLRALGRRYPRREAPHRGQDAIALPDPAPAPQATPAGHPRRPGTRGQASVRPFIPDRGRAGALPAALTGSPSRLLL